MARLTLKTPTYQSDIIIQKGSFLSYDFGDKNYYIITDKKVYSLYQTQIKQKFPNSPIFILPVGEKAKKIRQVERIAKAMLQCDCTRSTTIVAMGGGVVGDVAGLVASLYMRGVSLIQVPTTLLAQVDSSVGGKTAVNLGKCKNIIGTFYQPQTVIVDTSFLQTLSAQQLRCGLGEVVKYSALDSHILNLVDVAGSLQDQTFFDSIIPLCLEHKIAVVTQDERDMGNRQGLNLGHTTGHAIELLYPNLTHGECVLWGMWYELFIAVRSGICANEYTQILKKQIQKVLIVPAVDSWQKCLSLALHDKKNLSAQQIKMIIPKQKGEWASLILTPEQYLDYLQQASKAIKEGLW